MKKKKNKGLFIGIIIFVLILAGLGIYYYIENNRVEKISYNEFFNKMQKKDSFVLVVSKTDCQYCKMYLPKLENIAKEYKLKFYYVEVDTFTASESDSFSSYIDYNASTPTTVFINKGTEENKLNRINGNVKGDKLKEKLKNAGYIK